MSKIARIFLGRFQPLHKGHEQVIEKGLKGADKLIILVGTPNLSTSIKNPWTFEQRREMMEARYAWEISQGKIQILPLNDYTYNDNAWLMNFQRVIKDNTVGFDKIELIGHASNHVSYDTDIFKPIGVEVIKITVENDIFHSTYIRDKYLQHSPILPHAICSPVIVDYLEKFMFTKRFGELVAEQKQNKEYMKSWAASPFPPVFSTVDNVVVQSGHVLLIKRGDHPGIGQLALPGGFLNTKETLRQSAVRELMEETRIADGRGEIPPAVLDSYITKTETFDDPARSTRGRTITQAYLYELPDKDKLWTVKGSDDAAHAAWYPIGTVPSTEFFEDHYFVMCKMLGIAA